MDNARRETLLLAPYAMHAADSAGRRHEERAHAYRSPYQRDRDRIVHSSAYRRLAYKTQVFTSPLLASPHLSRRNSFSQHGGGYHRTRLTHTLEVASVARTLARALRVNEDLVEALALMHDIGHPPFGHAGEDVLNARLEGEGGFNHNAQALRIVERLEQRYPGFPGLNLTHEVLDGQSRRAYKPTRGSVVPDGRESPLLEVQIVDAADSIAYDAHDADDALELGMIEFAELETIELWRDTVSRVRQRFASLDAKALRRATIHELIDRQVSDLLDHAWRRLEELRPDSTGAVRHAPLIAEASPALAEQKRPFERFLFDRVYRHPRVLAQRMEATAALGGLFDHAADTADTLPAPYAEVARQQSPQRAAADYVSSVTDRFALEAAGALAG
ncbi:MAG: dGTP triphosphohydrolase [Planctomycetota bacterium]